jgi:site-specific DNA-methyltransferase (adenine-specific)
MNRAGNYQHPASGSVFPRIQIITVDQLLSGQKPKLPPTFLPYIQAAKHTDEAETHALFDI